MVDTSEEITWREKLNAIVQVVKYRPLFIVPIVGLGGVTAFLEGIGLSFIYPIMEIAQSEGEVTPQDAIMEIFLKTYEILGIPFELGNLIIGISIVMTVRFSSSFAVAWLRAILRRKYEQFLRTEAFRAALNARIGYFDDEGSDDILNAIITETRYSGNVINEGVRSMETLALVSVYLAIMIYIAPDMTLYAIVLLGGITYLLRNVLEPGYTIGNRVAEANESVQQSVQAGTQGIRDVKLFNLSREVFEEFRDAIKQYTTSSIKLSRNKAALQNGYDLAAAISLFALIYVGFTYSGLSLGALGIFLFAMFRLSPLASRLNSQIYNLEGNLSHLVRTQRFIADLHTRNESDGDQSIDEISDIEFDNVSFSYNDEENVLDGISFKVSKDKFIAFVGKSGAGKSTIVSLIARMYEPDSGDILTNETSIYEYDLREWRERIAVVRQQPFIFNDTLENNVTIGKRNATREELEQVCKIAKVDEFIKELPNGYKSQLGDDGVRLSGGQRQRIALARALLKDADFLVLDEATSDLDSNLEREVQASIESMDREYGMIAIAHRLSTVKNADSINTVAGGKIVEKGTHEELLEQNGKYAKLYEIQSKE